jgi:hypothetical protein
LRRGDVTPRRRARVLNEFLHGRDTAIVQTWQCGKTAGYYVVGLARDAQDARAGQALIYSWVTPYVYLYQKQHN